MTDLGVSPTPGSTRRASVPARLTPLADGRLWGLALPTARYRPELVVGIDPLGRPTEAIRLLGRTGYPQPIEHLVAELRSACLARADPGGTSRRFDALVGLAVALLRRAHDLSLPEAAALLDLDGAGLIQLVDAVLAALAGDPDDPGPAPLSPPGDGNARPS